MKLLSIQAGHNATVGLMKNGEITALLNQKKLDNIKNSAAFPRDAIEVVLAERGLGPQNIDEMIIAGRMTFPQHCLDQHGKEVASDHLNPPSTIRFVNQEEKDLAGIFLPGVFRYARARRHAKLRAEGITHSQNLALGSYLVSKKSQP